MYKIYKDNLSQEITYSYKNPDNSMVFFTKESPEYDKYLAWVAEGNEAEEWSAE
jgi:hypothetical protein